MNMLSWVFLRQLIRKEQTNKFCKVFKNKFYFVQKYTFYDTLYMVLMKYVLIDFCHQHIFSDLQRATLLGMWLIPVGFCLKFGWHRFIYVWSIFSIITAFITFKASRKPISGTTPR